MPSVTSADGTTIAYDAQGSGPAVVLVDGALCYRGAGPLGPLADQLKDRFTVYTYDRRGRGESADTLPYAVAREVEDLQAVVVAAGGSAAVYALSSGTALALATAASDSGITHLALYDPPFIAESGAGVAAKEYTEALADLLGAGDRGGAVALFMSHVGMPPQAIAGMRSSPGWAALEVIAPTLAYDDALLGDGTAPRALAASLTLPVLVMCGGASAVSLQKGAEVLAEAMPGARLRTLPDQTHDVSPAALAPMLLAFFAA